MRRALAALALLATMVGASARADTPRDTLHRGAAELALDTDPRGMSALLDHRLRSPYGLLYPYPPAPGEVHDTGAGWQLRGGLELGYFWVGGDEDETRFESYRRARDGLLLDLARLELWQPERGDWFELRAGSVGRDDPFFEVEGGRANRLRVRATWSGVPHRYASDAILLQGRGDVQRLPASLALAASTPEQIATALGVRDEQHVELQRNQGRLAARMRLTPEFALLAEYGQIDRHGSIPTSVGFTFPEYTAFAGQTLELAAPVDDRTHDFKSALEWSGETAQLNFGYRASFYRNRRESLALEQPFGGFGLAPIERSRLALAPDNDWHELRAELGAALPLRGRVTGTVSFSKSTQDEDLLAPTINPVALGATDLALWSSGAALSQESADASVDQALVDLRLSASPLRRLRLHARFRFQDQDTDTDYVARNPTTGQYGYIVEDGGHGSVLGEDYVGIYRPGVAGNRWQVRAIPFGQERRSYELGATWSAPLRTSLELRALQEDVERDVSARRETRDQRWIANLSTRALDFATARVGYEYATRDGGSIDYGIFSRYTSEALTGYASQFAGGDAPRNLREMVRPSLADLNGQRWKGRLNLALGERSDLVWTARLRSDDFGPDFGVTSERTRDLEAEWTLQVSPALSANLFASVESHTRRMASIHGYAAGTDGGAGSPTFPLANAWDVRARGSSVGWGGGLTTRPLAWLELSSSYVFAVTREKQDVSFASLVSLSAPDFVNAVPPRLPTLRSRDQEVETSLRVELGRGLAVRIFHRYERSAVDDFHQTGLPTLVGRRVYLGHEDADYRASFYGFSLQANFP